MRNLFFILAIASILTMRIAHADDLAGAFLEEKSEKFEGFYYEIYEFTADGSEGAFVAVLSDKFDTYLMLVDPAGGVSANDDIGSLRITVDGAQGKPRGCPRDAIHRPHGRLRRGRTNGHRVSARSQKERHTRAAGRQIQVTTRNVSPAARIPGAVITILLYT